VAGGDIVYLKTSDAKAWLASGASANEAAEAIGLVCTAASADEPLTIARFGSGLMFAYGPNISGTPVAAGSKLYLGTGGAFASTPSTGGTIAVAWVVGDGRICLETPWWAIAEDALAVALAADA
jgi:hypothetical protein